MKRSLKSQAAGKARKLFASNRSVKHIGIVLFVILFGSIGYYLLQASRAAPASRPIDFGMYVGGSKYTYPDGRVIYFSGSCSRERWLFDIAQSNCIPETGERVITLVQGGAGYNVLNNNGNNAPNRNTGETDTAYKNRINTYVDNLITGATMHNNSELDNHKNWINQGKAVGVNRTLHYMVPMSYKSYVPRLSDGYSIAENERYAMAANFEEGANTNGLWKAKYEVMAREMVNRGIYRPKLRLGWEADGYWFHWQFSGGEPRPAGGCTPSNTSDRYCVNVSNWKKYFANIRSWMLNAANSRADELGVSRSNIQFEFVWNMDIGSSDPSGNTASPRFNTEDAWPGDSVVDTIGLEAYCQTPNTLSYPNSTCFNKKKTDTRGLDYYASFAAQHGNKPLAFPEWGVNYKRAGDDPGFIKQMYDWMKTNNVAWASYFDRPSSSDEPHNDFELCPSPACPEGTRMPKASAEYKKLFTVNTCSNRGTPSSVSASSFTCSASAGSAPTTAQTYFDMIVTDISWSPENPSYGQGVKFSATIKNQGNSATPNGLIHGVLFKVDGKIYGWADKHTTSIAPGASVTVMVNGGPSSSPNGVYTAAGGQHQVLAHVDDINRIQNESNENNNTLTKTIAVAAAQTAGQTSSPTVVPPATENSREPTVVTLPEIGQQDPSLPPPVVTGSLILAPASADPSVTVTEQTVLINNRKITVAKQGEKPLIDTTTLPNGEHELKLVTKNSDGTEKIWAGKVIINNKLNPLEKVRNYIFQPLGGKSGRMVNIVMAGATTWVSAVTALFAFKFKWLLAKAALFSSLKP